MKKLGITNLLFMVAFVGRAFSTAMNPDVDGDGDVDLNDGAQILLTNIGDINQIRERSQHFKPEWQDRDPKEIQELRDVAIESVKVSKTHPLAQVIADEVITVAAQLVVSTDRVTDALEQIRAEESSNDFEDAELV